jgi:capsid assembly protease
MKPERALLLSKIFNAPLAIELAKLQVILHVLQPDLGLDLSGLSELLAKTQGKPPDSFMQAQKPPLPQPEGAIAVIDVMGSLVHRARGMQAESGVASYEAIGEHLKRLRADPRVGGILLRIDSPGGEVAGVYELARAVRETAQAKPMWSLIDGMGLSAGYLIASQTSRILLGSHSAVGSVGVILIHLDQSKADEQRGLKFTVLKRGSHKDDLNPHAPLSDSAMQFANKLLDREYDLFIEQVAQGRRIAEKKLRATEASIYFDEDAISLGLADGQSSFDEAVGEMQEHLAQAKTVVIPGGTSMAETTAPTAPPTPAQTTAQAAPPPLQGQQGVPVWTSRENAPVNPGPPPALAAPASALRSAADYEEIALLCKMARRPHLAAQYISEQKSVAEVRKLLLEAQDEEDSGSEVFSAFAGRAGAAQSLTDARPKQTLAQLMRQRLGLKEAR